MLHICLGRILGAADRPLNVAQVLLLLLLLLKQLNFDRLNVLSDLLC